MQRPNEYIDHTCPNCKKNGLTCECEYGKAISEMAKSVTEEEDKRILACINQMAKEQGPK